MTDQRKNLCRLFVGDGTDYREAVELVAEMDDEAVALTLKQKPYAMKYQSDGDD